MNEKLFFGLSAKKAAEFLGVKKQTLANWRHLRKGPVYHKYSRQIIYKIDDLKNFASARRIDPNDRFND